MTTSEAQKRASKKYVENNLERMNIRVPKGKKDVIKAHADAMGESINGFVNRAIEEAIKKDKTIV